MSTTLPAICAHCPVCGDALPAAPWLCARCETPHHAECAEYFGGCAIFGCRDGRLPERLEVATWPVAARTLRQYLWVRRAQWASLCGSALSFGTAIFGFPVLAVLLGHAPGSGAIATVATRLTAVAALGFFPLFALSTVASWVLRGRLTAALGEARSEALDLPRLRLRAALPALGRGGGAARWVEKFGWFCVALALLCVAIDGVKMLPVLVPALGVVLCARTLAGYVRDNQALVHRFEATYAPRLPEQEKPALEIE